ncbi:acyl carrier protein [uncultured Roseibium sp.]|uniref:acyl carrier protein n=1 Tax=uncultured Roseibium sp. TaxID=1936171 RepID=UPI0026070E64|nr:acyl carrier protein [uncultured Roseibium sp.]
MSEIAEKVKAIVARDLDVATWMLTSDVTLTKLGADSLDAIGLIMAVERELGCRIPHDSFRVTNRHEGEWTFGAFLSAVESAINGVQPFRRETFPTQSNTPRPRAVA